jgi:hypothetical protein
MRKLRINRIDFGTAFEANDFGSEAYLDSETGAVIIVTDETNMELEQRISEDDVLETVLSKIRADETLPEWERDMLIAAAEVEFAHDSERYRRIPKQDSHEGYRDMQAYIGSLEDEHLRELLEVAVHGSGAFRRFKDVLGRYPEARQAWFKFRDEREKRRMTEWLASEGIEPEFE